MGSAAEDAPDGFTLADDVVVLMLELDLFPQVDVFSLQLIFQRFNFRVGLLKSFVIFFAKKGVRKDLAEKLQAFGDLLGPLAFGQYRIKGNRTENPTASAQRNDGARL